MGVFGNKQARTQHAGCAGHARISSEVRLVQTPSFPRHLYEPPGTEFLRLPSSDTPAKMERHFLIQNASGRTVGAVTMNTSGNQVKNLYILPELRGVGFGSAALEAVEKKARDLHWWALEANVFANNMGMLGIIRDAGWTIPEKVEVDLYDGQRFHVVEKKLPHGITGRKSDSHRRWKPVKRFNDMKFADAPQATHLECIEETLAKVDLVRINFPAFTDADVSAGRSVLCYTHENMEAIRNLGEAGQTTLENAARQSKYPFKPAEIRRAMKRILRIKENDVGSSTLVVFAGHTGEFSRILKEQGFEVIHTDPRREAAEIEGMQCIQCASHRIPVIPDAEAYVSFEGFPALIEEHGLLTYLKALAETRKGLVLVSHYENPENAGKKAIVFLSEACGLGVEHLKTSNLFFTRIFASYKAREKIILDLRIVEEMERFEQMEKLRTPSLILEGEGAELKIEKFRIVSTDDIDEIAGDLGILSKEVVRSIKRLESAWLYGKSFEHED